MMRPEPTGSDSAGLVAGVDTHTDTHTLAALTSVGQVISTETFAADQQGYHHMIHALQTAGTIEVVGFDAPTPTEPRSPVHWQRLVTGSLRCCVRPGKCSVCTANLIPSTRWQQPAPYWPMTGSQRLKTPTLRPNLCGSDRDDHRGRYTTPRGTTIRQTPRQEHMSGPTPSTPSPPGTIGNQPSSAPNAVTDQSTSSPPPPLQHPSGGQIRLDRGQVVFYREHQRGLCASERPA